MDNLTNTQWVINNQPTTGISDAFLLDFTSNSKSYHVIDPSVDGEIYYVNTTDPEHPDADTVYRDSLWVNQAYRTIEISGGDDATNADAIAWFENNAAQQSDPHYALLESWDKPNIQKRKWLAQGEEDKTAFLFAKKPMFGDEVYVIESQKNYIIGADGKDYEKPISGGGGGGGSVTITDIAYADLVSARDEGTLEPGAYYRITDYETIINGAKTIGLNGGADEGTIFYARSAGHQFDLIVHALSSNALDERASAINHDGDDYFINSNLPAWNIKYTLDNDSSKYTWADENNGKGVIYYMRDEFGNECPYDFKNIQYLLYALALNDDSGEMEPDDFCFESDVRGRYGTPWDLYQLAQGGEVLAQGGEVWWQRHAKKFMSDDILNAIHETEVTDEYLSFYEAEWYYTFTIEWQDMETGDVFYDDLSLWGGCYNNILTQVADVFDGDDGSSAFGLNIVVYNCNDTWCHHNILQNCNTVINGSGAYNTYINSKNCIVGTDTDYNTIEDSFECVMHQYAYNNQIKTSTNIDVGWDCGQNTVRDSFDVLFGERAGYNVIDISTNINIGAGCCNNIIGSFCDNVRILSEADPETGDVNYITNCVINPNVQYLHLIPQLGSGEVGWCTVESGNYGEVDSETGDMQSYECLIDNDGSRYVYVGKNSNGNVKTWVPADLVPEEEVE